MKKLSIFLALFSVVYLFSQKRIVAHSTVKSVTVYFNSAEITQTCTVNLPKGFSEVILADVAEDVDENSVLLGSTSKNANILAYNYSREREKEVTDEYMKTVFKKKDDSSEIIIKKRNALIFENETNKKLLEILDKNQVVNGQNTNLNVIELNKLLEFNKAKRIEIDNKNTANNYIINDLDKKYSEVSRLDNIPSNGSVIVQVENDNAGSVSFNFSYRTSRASWNPYYTLKIDKINSPINLLYRARISNQTGIDWKYVKLSLASGNPNRTNQSPEISKWFLRYYNPNSYSRGDSSNEKQIEEVVVTAAPSRISQNQLNISFDIDKSYNILKNNVQSIDLNEYQIQTDYKYFTVPKFDKNVYLIGEVSDYSKYNLLPGEANIIFEDMLVGKTNINPQQTEENLKISLGKDKNIAIKRELIADKLGEKTFSSYKEQTYVYEISVRNNKKEKTEIEMKDQIPVSTDKDMTIEVLEKSGAEIDEENGIVKWKLNLNPNETKKLRFGFKIKYPKDKQIDNVN